MPLLWLFCAVVSRLRGSLAGVDATAFCADAQNNGTVVVVDGVRWGDVDQINQQEISQLLLWYQCHKIEKGQGL